MAKQSAPKPQISDINSAAYRPEIDGIRALAVLAVLINHCHTDWLKGGFLGVDIFFVISGYVITGSLSRSLSQQNSGDFRSSLAAFYRRRVQRLIPALASFLLITAVLSAVFIPEPGPFLRTAVGALFGISNLELSRQALDYFSESADLNPFTHTWSLAVEEQFYLLYPLIFFLCTKKTSPIPSAQRVGIRSTSLNTVLLITAVSSLCLFWTGAANESSYYSTLPRAWELIAGCLLFRFNATRQHPRLHLGILKGMVPSSIWIIVLAGSLSFQLDRTIATTFAVLATCGLIHALSLPSAVKTFFLLAPLQHIGRISYSLYLWHWGFLALARWTVGDQGLMLAPILIATIITSECSYAWIENPWRHRIWMSGNLGPILTSFGVNGIIAAFIASLGLGDGRSWMFSGTKTFTPTNHLLSAHPSPSPPFSPDLSRCIQRPKDRLRGAPLERLISSCTRDPAPPYTGPQAERVSEPRHIFILGDSHAGALQSLAHQLLQRGHRVTFLGRAGCPFPAGPGHQRPFCAAFQWKVEQRVLPMIQPGDAVVVANYLASHLADRGWPESRLGIQDASGRVLRSGDKKLRTFAHSLEAFSKAVAERGGRTILLTATPRLLQRELCTPQWYRPAFLGSQCREAVAEDQQRQQQIHNDLKAQIHSAELVNLQHFFCRSGCDLQTLSWLLSDTDHLSPAAASRLSSVVLAGSRR